MGVKMESKIRNLIYAGSVAAALAVGSVGGYFVGGLKQLERDVNALVESETSIEVEISNTILERPDLGNGLFLGVERMLEERPYCATWLQTHDRAPTFSELRVKLQGNRAPLIYGDMKKE